MTRSKGSFNNFAKDLQKDSSLIEHTVEELEKKGLSERAASYATMMAYMRRRRK